MYATGREDRLYHQVEESPECYEIHNTIMRMFSIGSKISVRCWSGMPSLLVQSHAARDRNHWKNHLNQLDRPKTQLFAQVPREPTETMIVRVIVTSVHSILLVVVLEERFSHELNMQLDDIGMDS